MSGMSPFVAGGVAPAGNSINGITYPTAGPAGHSMGGGGSSGIGGALGGAGAGAAAGSVLGPYGAIAGALLGLFGGLLNRGSAANAAKEQHRADKQAGDIEFKDRAANAATSQYAMEQDAQGRFRQQQMAAGLLRAFGVGNIPDPTYAPPPDVLGIIKGGGTMGAFGAPNPGAPLSGNTPMPRPPGGVLGPLMGGR